MYSGKKSDSKRLEIPPASRDGLIEVGKCVFLVLHFGGLHELSSKFNMEPTGFGFHLFLFPHPGLRKTFFNGAIFEQGEESLVAYSLSEEIGNILLFQFSSDVGCKGTFQRNKLGTQKS